MKKATIKKSTISGLLLTSVLLTGCGSSGGSSGITKPVYDATKTLVAKEIGFDVDASTYVTAGTISPILSTQGSVIQSSSNATGLGVDATADALVSFKQIAGGQDVDISHSDNTYVYEPHMMAGVENVDTNAYAKSLTAGELFVVSNVANYGDGANDYLSYGAWAYQPTTGTANQEIGVYADGGDAFTTANIAALTGEATYNGANGVAGLFNDVSDGGEVETFVADVTLRANFDTNMIGGTISNATFSKTTALNNAIVITLQDATINTTTGLWTDTTSTPHPFDDNGSSYDAGKWGGQFYGNGASDGNPEWAAGTFGSGLYTSSANTNYGQFIGTFIAKKE